MQYEVYSLSEAQRELALQGAARALAGRLEIGFAYAYGSFLDGPQFRDLDIGIYASAKGAEQNSLMLAAEIAGEIEAVVKVPVDVRIINHAPITFLFSVIRGRLLFDRLPEIREQLVEDVMRRYYDIRPILVHATREAFAEQA